MSKSIHHGSGKGHGDAGAELPDTSHIQNPDVLHEESDVNVRAIGKFIVILAISTAIAFGIIAGMYRGLEYMMREPPPSAVARNGDERLPPEPRLKLASGWTDE